MDRRSVLLGLPANLALAAPFPAIASAFPTKPIRIVIPFPAGGNTDVVARLMGPKLSERLGQPVIVDNKTGGSGIIAATAVANSNPDGHTVLFTASSIVLALHLAKSPPIEISDLLPITHAFDIGVAFGVAKSLGVSDLKGFLDLAKRQPGKLSYGSYGVGTGAHVIGEILNKRSGTDIIHVPYRGEAPAVNDLLAGQISSAFTSAGALGKHPQKIQMAAVSSSRRLTQFPDVPTFDELGFNMGPLTGWAGIFAPSKTPPSIASTLAAEFEFVLSQPDIAARLVELGYELVTDRSKGLDAVVKDQVNAWKNAVDEAKVAVD